VFVLLLFLQSTKMARLYVLALQWSASGSQGGETEMVQIELRTHREMKFGRNFARNRFGDWRGPTTRIVEIRQIARRKRTSRAGWTLSSEG
jgi:hypothetical protein